MLTREHLRRQIEQHIEGHVSLDDLAAWAVDRTHDGELDPKDEDLLAEILSTLSDAGDPHRFRWEEPDFDQLLDRLDSE